MTWQLVNLQGAITRLELLQGCLATFKHAPAYTLVISNCRKSATGGSWGGSWTQFCVHWCKLRTPNEQQCCDCTGNKSWRNQEIDEWILVLTVRQHPLRDTKFMRWIASRAASGPEYLISVLSLLRYLTRSTTPNGLNAGSMTDLLLNDGLATILHKHT